MYLSKVLCSLMYLSEVVLFNLKKASKCIHIFLYPPTLMTNIILNVAFRKEHRSCNYFTPTRPTELSGIKMIM